MVVLQKSDNQLYAGINCSMFETKCSIWVSTAFSRAARMASEKSEFEQVVITNRNYRKTIGEKSTIAM